MEATKTINIKLTQVDMEFFIKDLLSLDKGGAWHRHTSLDKITIEFTGNRQKMQKQIYEWLKIRVEQSK